MLIGGSRSSGSTPSQRSGAARLDSITFQSPSTIKAGFGSCASSSRSTTPEGLHHLPVVGQLQIGRREAPREQQSIALGDRQIEVLGQVDEELATRAGPAGLDEAQVLGRDVRVQGQLELAEAASRAPEADQLARGLGLLLGLDDHGLEVSGRPLALHER